MQAFYAKLDFNEVDSVPMEDRAFFSAGKWLFGILRRVHADLTQKIRVNTREVIWPPSCFPSKERRLSPRTGLSQNYVVLSLRQLDPPIQEGEKLHVVGTFSLTVVNHLLTWKS